MEQERISIEKLNEVIEEKVSLKHLLRKLDNNL
jgi:hypothetical protein